MAAVWLVGMAVMAATNLPSGSRADLVGAIAAALLIPPICVLATAFMWLRTSRWAKAEPRYQWTLHFVRIWLIVAVGWLIFLVNVIATKGPPVGKPVEDVAVIAAFGLVPPVGVLTVFFILVAASRWVMRGFHQPAENGRPASH